MPNRNPRKHKSYCRDYYRKHEEEIKGYAITRRLCRDDGQRARDIEQKKESSQIYREEHREELKQKSRAYHKAYYSRHKLKWGNKIREWRRNRKLTVLSHYSSSPPECACCGETEIDFLSLDHINNDGSKHRRETGTRGGIYSWVIKNNFPPLFQVLCMNCNFSKAHNKEHICAHKFHHD